jgi:chemotaxis protein MotB
MAATDKKIQPIIIKRIKKGGGHGHHGGAWKIAYADFVTAMMAFFLLMWLLGSTTKGDLQGIADHFNTPLQVALGGGSGSGDSSSVLKGGGEDLTRTVGQVKRGDVEQQRRSVNLQGMPADSQRAEAQGRRVKARVEEALGSNPKLRDLRAQVRIDSTAEGLRIQIVDDQNRPMFDSGSAAVKPYMRELLAEIARVLNDVDARITLTGHTDAAPFSGGERGYSNWELSADRANASRRELIAGGIEEGKILRVVGLASVVPLDASAPTAAVNRRISIVVMNKAAERRLLTGSDVQASDAGSFESAVAGAVQSQGVSQATGDARSNGSSVSIQPGSARR